jgi:hypothetical protein
LPKYSKQQQSSKYRRNEDYTKVVEKTLKHSVDEQRTRKQLTGQGRTDTLKQATNAQKH